jgi:hypothetical protein
MIRLHLMNKTEIFHFFRFWDSRLELFLFHNAQIIPHQLQPAFYNIDLVVVAPYVIVLLLMLILDVQVSYTA